MIVMILYTQYSQLCITSFFPSGNQFLRACRAFFLILFSFIFRRSCLKYENINFTLMNGMYYKQRFMEAFWKLTYVTTFVF